MIKEAKTMYPVHEIITERWSPRAFSNKGVTIEDVHTLLEAASWAPSAMNEQPWNYRFALQGTPGFDSMVKCLMPGNQPWAAHSAALVLSTGYKTYEKTGAANNYFMHDVGMANANLLTQALTMGIYGHIMGGFDHLKTRAIFNLSEKEEPVCFIALGYLGDPEHLEEPFKNRELAPRSRKSLVNFAFDTSEIQKFPN